MGKYILYAVIALIIAFCLNYFEIIDIPWLDIPFSAEAPQQGTQKVHQAAQEALGN